MIQSDGHATKLITVALLTLALLGCSAAPASESPGASVPASPVAPMTTPAVTPPASPTVTPIPTPTPMLAVGVAPAGAWNTLDWINAGAVLDLGPVKVAVHGWSGGYVAFDESGGDDGNGNVTPIVIRSQASADGFRCSPPTILDTSGVGDNVEVSGMVDGPSGLLALGYQFGDTCGGPEPLVALWTSADGHTWTRVAIPKDFRSGGALTVRGGAAGFIATGHRADGTTPAIWTSQDGRTWHAATLPKVSSGTLVIDDGVSFDGGFEVVGAVLGEGEGGGPAHIHAATWTSIDGTSWTRSSLSGSLTAPTASMTIRALSDGALLTTQASADDSVVRAWTSTDGRTWVPVDHPSDVLLRDPVGEGGHAVLVIDPDSGSGPPTVLGIDDHSGVTTLGQTGDGPLASVDSAGWTAAVGPTGVLLVGSDGGGVWLGVPR
jgi:hypothetical protein